jgi:hypothetical protein
MGRWKGMDRVVCRSPRTFELEFSETYDGTGFEGLAADGAIRVFSASCWCFFAWCLTLFYRYTYMSPTGYGPQLKIGPQCVY